MKEIWRDIPGYEGYYQVSSIGNVRSLSIVIADSNGRKRKTKEKSKSLYKNPSTGYMVFGAYVDNKRKTLPVHRSVAQAFIPNPDNKPQVNHINGIKTDNRVENLEWATASENIKHSFKTGLQHSTWKGKFGSLHHTSKSVSQYSLDGKLIASYGSASEAHREIGTCRSSICSACRGEYSQAGGFKWKFKNEEL